MTPVNAILDEARRILAEPGVWQRGIHESGPHRRDLLTALADAATRLGTPEQMGRAAARVMELVPRHPDGPVATLVRWNDAPGRSLAQVLGLLDAARGVREAAA